MTRRKNSEDKKVIVTGGAGFIGSHICDLLIKKGYQVHIIDELITGKKKNLNDKAQFHKLDIRDDKLNEVFKKINPDYVIHQAAQINVRDSIENPINDARHNIIGSINVIKSSIKSEVEKIVFASSGGAVYGDPDSIPAKEDTPTNPLSPYAIAKRSVEHYLRAYSKMEDINYTVLRYSNVYGPRQDPKGEAGVISIFTDLMLEGKQAYINGNGEQTRDFVYAADVARANLLAIKKETDHKIFNIGTGKKTSVNKLYKTIKKAVGSNKEAKHRDPIPGEVQDIALDISRAKKELGWQPKIKLEEGIEKTVKWFKGQA